MNIPYGERPFSEVIQDIVGNFQDLVRSEFRLAKAETKEEATKAARAGSALAMGAIFGFYALGFLLLTIVYALALAVGAWAAALIVGGVLAIIAAIMISVGRKRLKQVQPAPHRTIDTVKENVQWMRDQTR